MAFMFEPYLAFRSLSGAIQRCGAVWKVGHVTIEGLWAQSQSATYLRA